MLGWLVRLVLVVVVAVAGAVLRPANVACACSCRALTTAEAVAQASAVFEGDVTAVVPPSRTGQWSSNDPVAYTVRVAQVYKGSVPAETVVTSATSEASCGVELKGHVVVFADGPAYAMSTTLCSVPAPLNRSQLGPGRPPATRWLSESPPPSAGAPAPSADGSPSTDSSGWWATVTWLALGGAVVLGGLLVWRRRHRG